MPLEMPSLTHSEVSSTNLRGTSQCNQVDNQEQVSQLLIQYTQLPLSYYIL